MEKIAEDRNEITRNVLKPWITNDILDFASMSILTEEGYNPIEILRLCESEHIRIILENRVVEASWVLRMHMLLVKQSSINQRKRQEAGIQKALKKKQEGKGEYGRPCIELPADFEKQVREKLENKESLAQYYETLHIKRSTFYKWTRFYKQKWKEERLEELKANT